MTHLKEYEKVIYILKHEISLLRKESTEKEKALRGEIQALEWTIESLQHMSQQVPEKGQQILLLSSAEM